jgi:hypothetical protein
MTRRKRIWIVLFAGMLLASAGAAATEDKAAPPKCLKAEINPVTGHVFCIDPLGAPVEPPEPQALGNCKPEEARGQWSWGPGCTVEPEM